MIYCVSAAGPDIELSTNRLNVVLHVNDMMTIIHVSREPGPIPVTRHLPGCNRLAPTLYVFQPLQQLHREIARLYLHFPYEGQGRGYRGWGGRDGKKGVITSSPQMV